MSKGLINVYINELLHVRVQFDCLFFSHLEIISTSRWKDSIFGPTTRHSCQNTMGNLPLYKTHLLNLMVFLKKFLLGLLKICIQIKWICQIKRDSLASLVHNNSFRSLITTTGCVFLCWIQRYFSKFSTTIIKDCVKQKNI